MMTRTTGQRTLPNRDASAATRALMSGALPLCLLLALPKTADGPTVRTPGPVSLTPEPEPLPLVNLKHGRSYVQVQLRLHHAR
jgi:hypothetical protein